MTEGFDLKGLGGFFPDGPDLLQTQFPGQYHPLSAQIVPSGSALIVGDGLLGGNVPGTVWGVFSSQRECTQIRQNQGIHTGSIQLFQIGRQLRDFPVPGHGVHGDMDLDSVVMGKFYRQGQLLRGEVSRKGAHSKVGACQIDRIGAVKHGHLQSFHVSGRT